MTSNAIDTVGSGTTNLNEFGNVPEEVLKLESLTGFISKFLEATYSQYVEDEFFRDENSVELLKKFLVDSGVVAVYIGVRRALSNDQGSSKAVFELHQNLTFTNDVISWIVVLKRNTPLVQRKLLEDQLLILTLPGFMESSSIYESLHAYLHSALSPFFSAYLNSKSSNVTGIDSDLSREPNDIKLVSAKKRLAELELSFLQLQQNIEVPEVVLNINPHIAEAIHKANTQGRKALVEDLGSLADDPSFLNKLQSEVNVWVKQVQRVTKMTRDISKGSASQEINFWLSMEKELENIDRILKTDGFVLTMDVLRYAKRFHATVSFMADTGLKETTETVQKYNVLMKDFPISELLAASDLEKVKESIILIFSHLNKKLRLCPYPIERAIILVEAISSDLNDQVHQLLSTKKLFRISFEEFSKCVSESLSIFKEWDEQVKEFITIAREVSRKRSTKFVMIKVTGNHLALKERIEYLFEFRKQHFQLQEILSNVLSASSKDNLGINEKTALSDIDLAFSELQKIDVIDVSSDGISKWVEAEAKYNNNVSRVENHIILYLRDKLSSAKNSNDMFRIFFSFNSLFVRPKIRGAVQEYQNQLIQSVKQDIQMLQNKFKTQYRNSDQTRIGIARDIPNTAGTIVWMKMIGNQLNNYMKKVQVILGSSWSSYVEGQALQAEYIAFSSKLDTKPIYDAWLSEVSKKNMVLSGPVLSVNKNRASNSFELKVNFDPDTIKLFKETRNLVWLGFNIPHSILHIAKDAKRIYPFAMSLTDSVRSYEKSVGLIASLREDRRILIAVFHKNVQESIKKIMAIHWEQFMISSNSNGETETAVYGLFSAVSVLQEKIHVLFELTSELDKEISNLNLVEFDLTHLENVIKRISAVIERLQVESFSNIDHYIEILDSKIEDVLVKRLEEETKRWLKNFENRTLENIFRLEIILKNQILSLEPSIEDARLFCFSSLEKIFDQVSLLHRVSVFSSKSNQFEPNKLFYRDLPSKISIQLITQVYDEINHHLVMVEQYCNEWLSYQSLWDLELVFVVEQLGPDLERWIQVIQEVKHARILFDNQEYEKKFGIIVVNYIQVQQKVNSKYDSWQKEIVGKFIGKLQESMSLFYNDILKIRHNLEERPDLESCSTKEALSYITFIEEVKGKMLSYSGELQHFSTGQKILERQRLTLPENWVYFEKVESEWNAFNELFKRKVAVMDDQLLNLQNQIKIEANSLNSKIFVLIEQWNKDKPVQGDIEAELAINTINEFDLKFKKYKEDSLQIKRAKEALLLPEEGYDLLTETIQELSNLTKVWTELKTIWDGVMDIKKLLFQSVVGKTLRERLEATVAELKCLPASTRQYEAFEYLSNHVKLLIKVNILIIDLRSDCMKERHWKLLFKKLNVRGLMNLNELTLGQVYDFDLVKNESKIKEVATVAQGEMALEEYVKAVKDFWQTFSLEMVNYSSNGQIIRLIKGFDGIFSKCSEHIAGLQSMKLSPYFKVFEDEVSNWEEKIDKIHVLFDSWIDVQRQWVYLEGIFMSSADIKNLLPQEHNRFSMINSEFLNLMRKVMKSASILDVIQISNLQVLLERLLEVLTKIQKALGEYLENERSRFARFYFLGDEDLLEIIGNSKDISRIQKHLRKMFSGIFELLVDDQSKIIGMREKSGETVMFYKSIPYKDLRINEWLKGVEIQMKESLYSIFEKCMDSYSTLSLLELAEMFPFQIAILTLQVKWTSNVEKDFGLENFQKLIEDLDEKLVLLSRSSSKNTKDLCTKKAEYFIAELVYQRNILRKLVQIKVKSKNDHQWQNILRFYHKKGSVYGCLSDAEIEYGFEYVGIADRLVQTPLTNRCNLTLTQALKYKFGASPFGPAGTGKTESVKFLGAQLAKFVLVFCCDEQFDHSAVGRIFVGLCQVGAWACFDEFNRLSERMLSTVSQQIQVIQEGLRNSKEAINLLNKNFTLNENTAIFITMNPDYAGRSQLPNNLKKLFRPVAMTKPDKETIAEVLLYSQGFKSAEELSKKTVPLFQLLEEQLSKQSHYDFGLRALKSVLGSAGRLKQNMGDSSEEETRVLIKSICETVEPKLTREDEILFKSLLSDFFPSSNVENQEAIEEKLQLIKSSCSELGLISEEQFEKKILQLNNLIDLHHGVMMIGNSGSGKSSALKVLTKVRGLMNGNLDLVVVHRINPKSISKDDLFGTLDTTTREWTDGLFTHILRKIIDNIRNEADKLHWIVFDGEVDPRWCENLNSVLDDNKMLTLPNGERLGVPSNVRLIFEVEDLTHATLATVSRCGMIWFHDTIISAKICKEGFLKNLEEKVLNSDIDLELRNQNLNYGLFQIQKFAASLIKKLLRDDTIDDIVRYADTQMAHVMDFNPKSSLETFFVLIKTAILDIASYQLSHSEYFTMIGGIESETIELYLSRKIVSAVIWAFSGDCALKVKENFSKQISILIPFVTFPSGQNGFELDVELPNADYFNWQNKVVNVELDSHSCLQKGGDLVVINTSDTLRNENFLTNLLFNAEEIRPVILCGPPGSGKTMTLFNCLRNSNVDVEIVGMNFSSSTSPEYLLKTIEQHTEYRKTPSGLVMKPKSSFLGKKLVIFCDEINLPSNDEFGTQRVISFMRQLIEQNGFWKVTEKQWVQLERIQFVGACNPPTDPGRVALSKRFLRNVAVLFVDYPSKDSLMQIYKTFIKALLKVCPNLKGMAESLTKAMVEFYLQSQAKFTQDQQPHYIYSPRELTRWLRGIYEAIKPSDGNSSIVTAETLVRIFVYEGLRLFHDRLVNEEERRWTTETIEQTAKINFPQVNLLEALKRPILFSNWLDRSYTSVDEAKLISFVEARLKVFYEEEIESEMILYNEAVDHLLRIDRVLRQPQGHLLLIGPAGGGRTTWTRFVCWMNAITVIQIRTSNRYTSDDFDEDLRSILKRTGSKNEKICLIVDETNISEPSFLERLNSLLSNGEIPGLFEAEEYNQVMNQCKETSAKEGILLQQDELPAYFQQRITRNLHVVFTLSPPAKDSNKATASPALFNRCVLNWYGEFSDESLKEIARKQIEKLDLTTGGGKGDESLFVENVLDVFVNCHKLTKKLPNSYITPNHYLDLIKCFIKMYQDKKQMLEDEQRHLHAGLSKLEETVELVSNLRKSLTEKNRLLEEKSKQANEKLEKMVSDQKEAEEKKAISLDIRKQLELKNGEIETRKSLVMSDLARAEPAVEDAKQSVSNIKKQQLTEIRSMANPPKLVKLTMEAVCQLLQPSQGTMDWKTVQQIIRKDDFIQSIVNFDTNDKMTAEMRDKIRKDYLSLEDFNFESVNRASKACGPLVQWLVAQVTYSEMLNKVGPLRDEVASLEKEAEKTNLKLVSMEQMISELEQAIKSYKEEYAFLISNVQTLKQEMDALKVKVERSMNLIQNLSSEKDRWMNSSESFMSKMMSLTGNVILSSLLLCYLGYFDQKRRTELIQLYRAELRGFDFNFDSDLSIIDYNLVDIEQKVKWETCGLSINDETVMQNALMLTNSVQKFKYPLLIDPTGKSIDFVKNYFSDSKNIVVTSFLDESFQRTLESAIRFGNILIVTDAEMYDPLLNPVLNREVRKTGGRNLIKIGCTTASRSSNSFNSGVDDIDFSPRFQMFLFTRHPHHDFNLYNISSRCRLINFSMTQSSLEKLVLNKILDRIKPEIGIRKRESEKLQGEYNIKLRKAEISLLNALTESQGNLLENDNVLSQLESLNSESRMITSKKIDCSNIIAELDGVVQAYNPVAEELSKSCFLMINLEKLSEYYQFSIELFLRVFDKTLAQYASDIQFQESFVDRFYLSLYQELEHSLLKIDLIAFGLNLSYIKLKTRKENVDETLLDWYFKRQTNSSNSNVDGVSRSYYLENFKFDIATDQQKLQKLSNFYASVLSKNLSLYSQITLGSISSSDPNVFLAAAAISKTIYPEKGVALDSIVVQRILGDSKDSFSFDLEGNHVFAVLSVPGLDSSYRVESLAGSHKVRLTSIAIGSNDSQLEAERSINDMILNEKFSGWLLLKNIHLAETEWLQQVLEKKLYRLVKGGKFKNKLFFTMETCGSKKSFEFLKLCKITLFESGKGFKYSISDSLRSVESYNPNFESMVPIEKHRLYFLSCFLHTVIIERLRFSPFGFTKSYDFNSADFECCLRVIDSFVVSKSANALVENIPFSSISELLKESVYGGRIDNQFDQGALNTVIDYLFRKDSFNSDYKLRLGHSQENNLVVPDVLKISQYFDWPEKLSQTIDPSYVGLRKDADLILSIREAKDLDKRITQIDIDNEYTIVDLENISDDASGIHLKRIFDFLNSATSRLSALSFPDEGTYLTVEVKDTYYSPLISFFMREVKFSKEVSSLVLTDMTNLKDFLSRKTKGTNLTRKLFECVSRGEAPSWWKLYKNSSGKHELHEWFEDLRERLTHSLNCWNEIRANVSNVLDVDVWLGGLFNPEAYLTATRQYFTRKHGWSLEKLKLEVQFDCDSNVKGCFRLSKFRLYGVRIEDNELVRSETPFAQPKEILCLRWKIFEDSNSNQMNPKLPFYLNEDRKDLLADVELPFKEKGKEVIENLFREGICILAQ